MNYDHLVGLEFKYGEQDCYSLVRDFYRDVLDIDLPNYARPEEFWEHGMEMYRDRFTKNGFSVVTSHPSEWQFGDVFLMSIRSRVVNHAAVLVENGEILHHLYGRSSVVEPYRGIYRHNTMLIVRHKDVKALTSQTEVDFKSLLPPATRRKLDELLDNLAQTGAIEPRSE